MNAIEIKDLCKAYPKFNLDNISLTLPCGCIMGLIGENGAGKSTLIKLILNIVRRDCGSITVLGRDNRTSFELTKEDIGVVLDEVGIPSCLNALQVGKIMKLTFKNWDDAVYAGYLAKMAVPTDKKFKDFSRGMKMKLGIAVALSHGAKLLILDEATSGLDPVVRDEILDVFNEFTRNEQNSVLISSHIVSDLEKICDYIAFMHGGRLLLCEEKDALLEKYRAVHCSADQLRQIRPSAVLGKKESEYGAEAVVLNAAVPLGVQSSPVDIEQLFVYTVRGCRK